MALDVARAARDVGQLLVAWVDLDDETESVPLLVEVCDDPGRALAAVAVLCGLVRQMSDAGGAGARSTTTAILCGLEGR